MSKQKNEHQITFTDEPNAVTIRITGRAFENLREIATIFNQWDKDDNTPADMVRRFLCDSDCWQHLAEKKPTGCYYCQTFAGSICSEFDDDDTDDLKRAFEAAGFSVEW